MVSSRNSSAALRISELYRSRQALCPNARANQVLPTPVGPVRNRCWCSRTQADSAVRERTIRSEEHTSELQSLRHLVCRLLLEKKKKMPCHMQSVMATHLLLRLGASYVTA